MLRGARSIMERKSAVTLSYALSLATKETKAMGEAIRIFEKANPGHTVWYWRVGVTETLERVLGAVDLAIAEAEESR